MNPVRTQEAYNIDMFFEAGTRIQTLIKGTELSGLLTG